jgi:small GTP-binding protein
LGLANSGKTTLVNRLQPKKQNDESAPTVGFSVERFTLFKTKLTVIDMSGQRKYQKLQECYYHETNAIIFVVDSADGDGKIDEARDVLSDLLKHESMKNKPLILFANKSDLPKARSASEIAVAMELSDGESGDRAWHVGGCCAKTGEGVEEGMRWVLEKM